MPSRMPKSTPPPQLPSEAGATLDSHTLGRMIKLWLWLRHPLCDLHQGHQGDTVQPQHRCKRVRAAGTSPRLLTTFRKQASPGEEGRRAETCAPPLSLLPQVFGHPKASVLVPRAAQPATANRVSSNNRRYRLAMLKAGSPQSRRQLAMLPPQPLVRRPPCCFPLLVA